MIFNLNSLFLKIATITINRIDGTHLFTNIGIPNHVEENEKYIKGITEDKSAWMFDNVNDRKTFGLGDSDQGSLEDTHQSSFPISN